MNLNKMMKAKMTGHFSLNQEEVVIQFTDSVTKVKGSCNVMFDEIRVILSTS